MNLSDLAQLLSNYGTAGRAEYHDGDLDCDGDIHLADLAALLAVYGAACSWGTGSSWLRLTRGLRRSVYGCQGGIRLPDAGQSAISIATADVNLLF